MGIMKSIFKNFRKPGNNLLARWIVKGMNRGHNQTALWCIDECIKPEGNEDALDIGCGGGQNVANLLLRSRGKVCGIDHSPTCVAIASKKNTLAIAEERCEIREGSVSELPYEDESFDLVTAFETIYFWPSIAEDFRQVYRVLKPGGRFFICNEAYKVEGNELWVKHIDMRIYSPEEMEELLRQAGFVNISHSIAPNSKLQRISVQGQKA